jgi:hypothetical protein
LSFDTKNGYDWLSMGHESFGAPKAEVRNENEFTETLYADTIDGHGPELPPTPEFTSAEREAWNPEEDTARYQERRSSLIARQKEVDDMLSMIHEDEAIAERFDEDQMHELFNSRETLQQELLATSANYPGDWTGLLFTRMSSPVSKEKFIAQRTEALPALKEGDIPTEDKGGKYEKAYQAHYQAQIDEYDSRLQEIFSSTGIGKAVEHGKVARNLGQNRINNPGVVFTDAIHQGRPLSSRQMNMVESHEKGHGVRDFTSPIDRFELQSLIDPEPLQDLTLEYRELERTGQKEGLFNRNYVEHPDEIIERMSQFKNYFGMGATDTFTKQHLDYIRTHYITDTGLDNGVTDLLRCITPKTEAAFLKIINKYPI